MIIREEIIENCTLYLGDSRSIIDMVGHYDVLVTDPPYGIGERSGTISKQRNRNDYAFYDDTEDNIRSVVIPIVETSIAAAGRAIVTPGGKCAWLYPKPTDIGMAYQPAACGMTHWGRTTCQPILFYGRDPHVGKTIHPLHYQLVEQPERNGHPCPKPIKFMKWLVVRGSLPQETVFDPFMGSGTTGVACIHTGRKFIGVEIDEIYFDIAVERLRRAAAQPDLFSDKIAGSTSIKTGKLI